jgi:O-methyltransferase involved in polyketide biosynthesis
MSNSKAQKLRGVPESLLLPLCIRAVETQRPDALIKDEDALALVRTLELDEAYFSKAQVSEEVQISILLRNREFDRIVRDYLARCPDAVIIHIGCGLDTRFGRLDNGQLEWYDLDLPEVIELRWELIGGEGDRYHLLGCSAIDTKWMDRVHSQPKRAYLFLAEGVFMFFEQAQVKWLVLELMHRFPGAELAFDAFSPFYVWANNRRVARSKVGVRTNWAIRHPREPENWAEGIRLLKEWYPFLEPEPRLEHISWVRFLPLLSKTTGIFYYQLGKV